MYAGNTPIQANNRPLVFPTSGNYIDRERSQCNNRQHGRNGRNTITESGTRTEEHYLSCVAHQDTIPAYLQAPGLLSSRKAGLMTVETHRNVVEHKFPLTTPGVMDILSSKPFYVYMANLTAKPVNFPKFMTVASASNVPSCIIHTGDDMPCMTETEGKSSHNATQLN